MIRLVTGGSVHFNLDKTFYSTRNMHAEQNKACDGIPCYCNRVAST